MREDSTSRSESVNAVALQDGKRWKGSRPYFIKAPSSSALVGKQGDVSHPARGNEISARDDESHGLQSSSVGALSRSANERRVEICDDDNGYNVVALDPPARTLATSATHTIGSKITHVRRPSGAGKSVPLEDNAMLLIKNRQDLPTPEKSGTNSIKIAKNDSPNDDLKIENTNSTNSKGIRSYYKKASSAAKGVMDKMAPTATFSKESDHPVSVNRGPSPSRRSISANYLLRDEISPGHGDRVVAGLPGPVATTSSIANGGVSKVNDIQKSSACNSAHAVRSRHDEFEKSTTNTQTAKKGCSDSDVRSLASSNRKGVRSYYMKEPSSSKVVVNKAALTAPSSTADVRKVNDKCLPTSSSPAIIADKVFRGEPAAATERVSHGEKSQEPRGASPKSSRERRPSSGNGYFVAAENFGPTTRGINAAESKLNGGHNTTSDKAVRLATTRDRKDEPQSEEIDTKVLKVRKSRSVTSNASTAHAKGGRSHYIEAPSTVEVDIDNELARAPSSTKTVISKGRNKYRSRSSRDGICNDYLFGDEISITSGNEATDEESLSLQPPSPKSISRRRRANASRERRPPSLEKSNNDNNYGVVHKAPSPPTSSSRTSKDESKVNDVRVGSAIKSLPIKSTGAPSIRRRDDESKSVKSGTNSARKSLIKGDLVSCAGSTSKNGLRTYYIKAPSATNVVDKRAPTPTRIKANTRPVIDKAVPASSGNGVRPDCLLGNEIKMIGGHVGRDEEPQEFHSRTHDALSSVAFAKSASGRRMSSVRKSGDGNNDYNLENHGPPASTTRKSVRVERPVRHRHDGVSRPEENNANSFKEARNDGLYEVSSSITSEERSDEVDDDAVSVSLLPVTSDLSVSNDEQDPNLVVHRDFSQDTSDWYNGCGDNGCGSARGGGIFSALSGAIKPIRHAWFRVGKPGKMSDKEIATLPAEARCKPAFLLSCEGGASEDSSEQAVVILPAVRHGKPPSVYTATRENSDVASNKLLGALSKDEEREGYATDGEGTIVETLTMEEYKALMALRGESKANDAFGFGACEGTLSAISVSLLSCCYPRQTLISDVATETSRKKTRRARRRSLVR